jgi:hypothetical protein
MRGFEKLDVNSYEQLCSNYAAEVMQEVCCFIHMNINVLHFVFRCAFLYYLMRFVREV